MIKSHRFVFLVLAVCCFAAVIAYGDQPLSEWLRTVDESHHAITSFFQSWTDLGKSKWYLWPAAIGVIVCAILVRKTSLTQRLRKRAAKIGDFLLFLFLCVAASGILTDMIKPIAGRGRPVELEEHGVYGFEPFSFTARWNSMPSGHATTAFTLAFVLASTYPRLRVPAFILAFILAISRIIVNAHYLSDVIAGGVVAFLTVAALQRLKTYNGIFHINKRIFPIDGKSG